MADLHESTSETPPESGAAAHVTLMDVIRAIFTPDDVAPPMPPQAELEAPTQTKVDATPQREMVEAEAQSVSQAGVSPVAVTLAAEPTLAESDQATEVTTSGRKLALVAGTLGALLLGYLGQRSLSVAQRDTLGVTLYALAAFLWLAMLYFEFGTAEDRWAWVPRIKWYPEDDKSDAEPVPLPRRLAAIEPPRLYLAAAGLSLSALTYLATANNRLTFVGLVAWLGSIAVWIIVLSEKETPPRFNFLQKAQGWLRRPTLQLRLEPFAFLVLLVLLVAAYYRFHLFDSVPPEMTSDHVEKLLDAYDVQQGRYSVFFPRNGGREAIQMYMVALAANVFGTGISFDSLKLTSALEGLALIPVVVALGKELIDRETGLLAALLVAVSWWHTSLSRMGLRIVLTPLVMGLVLITLLRGLRTNERRHFIATGIWLGVGVYCYQALRAAPLVVAAGVALAMLDPEVDRRWRGRLLGNLLVAGMLALVIFAPMARFWADSPEIMWSRTITRTTSSEIAIEGSPTSIFVKNVADALLMFNWQGDIAWISAVPGAPLLDVATGFLFILGLLAWWMRLVVRRRPAEAIAPIAILTLMLPSALAIAFPVENPSATRASGVIPLVYLLAAWPLTLVRKRWTAVMGRAGRRLALVVSGALVLIAGLFNYDAYFHRYLDSYRASGLNPSEVGEAVAGFAASGGSLDNAYLQGYPFWHDYRAIGIEAGDITWDNAILDTQHLTDLLAQDPRFGNDAAKLFIVHPEDEEARDILSEAYSDGQFTLKKSVAPDHDFYIFVVPAGSRMNASIGKGEAPLAE